jgi:hypothetical protein
VIVPFAIVSGLFLYASLRPTVSGAGLSEDNRPVAIYLLAGLGAAGWLLGSSVLFAIHRPASRLPRAARYFAVYLLWGPARMDSLAREGALPPAATTLSATRLASLAILELPLLLFTAPLVLGLLAQPGVYRPEEAAAAAATGLAVGGWSLFLARRL